MSSIEQMEMAEFIYQDLRLRTMPVGTKFFDQVPSWPDKTRRPSQVMKQRITICQAMTLARLYRWTVGLTNEDMICPPARLIFGWSKAPDPRDALAGLFSRVGWCGDKAKADQEMAEVSFLEPGQYPAMVLAPLAKGLFEPDTVSLYGNPAQVMRLVQAWAFMDGALVKSLFGGKVACNEYLLAPLLSGEARVCLPGNGDRVMSMTQDDEMAFALPGSGLAKLVEGLKQAGRGVGARYPVPFYQNFTPRFPKALYEVE